MEKTMLKLYAKYLCSGFFAILMSFPVFSAGKIYKKEVLSYTSSAYSIHLSHNHYGIVANVPDGAQIEVRMFYKRKYTVGGRGDNSLVYGVYADGRSTNNEDLQNKTWEVPNDFSWYCPGKVGCGKRGSDGYKNRIRHAIESTTTSSGGFKTTLTSVTSEMVVEIELSGNVSLANIHQIRLPGVEVLEPSAFIIYEGDFSALFNEDDQVTVVAHRGYWEASGVVQNSIAAIDAANDISGLNWIELDVRSSEDYHPILFHDDKPQKILQGISDSYSNSSVYDLTWHELKDYKLYDRFNEESPEKLRDLDMAFYHIKQHKIKKPVNLDIGIPDEVPQGGEKVDGRPFFDSVFVKAIELACHYGLTNQVVFKGKYTWNHAIWEKVESVLQRYGHETGGVQIFPKIAYTPKLGDDTQDAANYFDNWLDVKNGKKMILGLEIVGMEIRLKNDHETVNNAFLKNAIQIAQAADLKIGVFSEAPSTCQGYWTKSAVEKYINFKEDRRNDLEWLLKNGYDYIITDFPKNLIELRSKKYQL